MNNFKIKKSLLSLALVLPAFASYAAADVSKEVLQEQLVEIQSRLDLLEGSKGSSAGQSDTTINVYGTLRPTFGLTSTDSTDSWDVADALSRIGIAAEHKLTNGLTGFAKGEFKVHIENTGNFGDARKAYVGIKGDFGRVAIGKQDTTQYAIIGDPVDIFNRASTPLAYDDVGQFRQQELVSYRKSFGNVDFRIEGQFKGDSANEGSDFVNGGVKYNGEDFTLAVGYLTKDLAGTDQKTVGVSASKSMGDWYVAAAYQDIDNGGNNLDITTLDLVGAYKISETYKVKMGYSVFSDDLVAADSKEITRINGTVEWHGSPDFYLFAEVQNNSYEDENVTAGREDSNQFIVGMRYNFDYSF
ncbi:MAG: porin [Colwellia sp.]|nr:porin [Colwellia sp.]